MTHNILRFKEIEDEHISLVGGKAANLGILEKAGFDIPPGYCITTISYTQFIQHHSIDAIIRSSINSKRYEDIQENIRVSPVPYNIRDEIQTESEFLSEPLVVRSSASSEDLQEASFAGQYNTYLGVTKKNLLHVIKKCWASLWTERAIAYRESNKIVHEKVLMAVIVQEMIFSEVSGVLFTINPVNQKKDEIVIEAVWGFGDMLVSGATNPDRFISLKYKGKVVKKEKGSQNQLTVYKDGKMQKTQVPWHNKKRFSLLDNQILRLTEIGEKIEEHYNFPQDIEWTISKDRIYILQSRPITKLVIH